MFRLDGKHAIVTGGASGIGAAIARLFASRGARVSVLDLQLDAASALAADASGEVLAFACDVSDRSAVERAFAAARAALGPIDILVNNAGVAHVGDVTSTEEEDFDRLYRVNVKGVYLCTRAAAAEMKERRTGAILNLASIASKIGIADRFAYSMTKGAVLTMTYSCAVDLMPFRIRVNCVCPARIHTPFVDGFLARSYPGREAEMFEKLSKYQPMGRMGKPEEVAALALYLCSDEAAFVTGGAFPIDGGVLVT